MKILYGDAADRLKDLESESINTCVTSPPYYNLRNYKVAGQIGMEGTPEEYIADLLEVFREVYRVLRHDGTLWVNIGDSYATSSGSQAPTNTRNSHGHTAKSVPKGYKRKDIIGIPWMLAFALRADGWYLRQDIIWSKPNTMPESVKDRCTRSHEYIFLLSKSPKYYFDAEAISEPMSVSTVKRLRQDIEAQMGSFKQPGRNGRAMKTVRPRFGDRRNKRDVWSITTGGYRSEHFAVFPEKLVEPCILAGCPEGGVVLDPFSGSGTTGAVAKRLGRDFVGVEINPQYRRMAIERIAAVATAKKEDGAHG